LRRERCSPLFFCRTRRAGMGVSREIGSA